LSIVRRHNRMEGAGALIEAPPLALDQPYA